MGSKISKAKPVPSIETKTVTIPRIPQELIDEILDHLATDSVNSVSKFLKPCALVSKSWVPSCRRHIFHTVVFAPKNMSRWFLTFPVPEESPAHFVRDLQFSMQGCDSGPEKFCEYIPWFTNVERVALLGYGSIQPSWISSLWGLPQSVTSLSISTAMATLVQVRDVMVQLPNLDDLSLSGSLAAVDKETLLGIGTVLKGRFGGRLRLLGDQAYGGAVEMLSEIPTGLRFTNLQIRGVYGCLHLTVRLAEACGETLVKLSYIAIHYRDLGAPEQSFDFSKLPNIQLVNFVVGWAEGGLPWIPAALSTLRPASSRCLSVLLLNFFRSPSANRSVEPAVEYMGDDLRRIIDEIARIKREFQGAVKVTVLWDSGFKAVLNALNIPPS